VFWVPAKSNESIQAAFVELARKTGVHNSSSQSSDDDNVCIRMKKWLEGPRSGIWVLVLDGMDTRELEARKYIPTRNGNIIVTTRNAHILGDFVGVNQGIPVGKMEESEALNMFGSLSKKQLDDPLIRQEADRLLDMLDHMALPIKTAAALIRNNHLRISEYIRLFTQSQEDKESVLSYAAVYTWNPDERPSTIVMTTWTITFSHLRNTNPASLELLGTMAYMDPTSIRRDILSQSQEKEQRIAFFELMNPLLAVSLVTALNEDAYRMHSLISFCVRLQMAMDQITATIMRAAILMVTSVMPEDESDPRAVTTLSHALSLSEHVVDQSKRAFNTSKYAETTDQFDNSIVSSTLGTMEYLLGKYLFPRGNYTAAITHGEKAYAIRHITESTNEEDYPEIMECIAQAYWNKNKHEQMRKWIYRAYEEKKGRFGPDDVRTLDTVGRIATYFHFAGDLDEAIKWHRRDFAGKERQFGKADYRLIKIINNMGNIYFKFNNYKKALEMHDDALSKALTNPHFPPSKIADLELSRAREWSKLNRPRDAREVFVRLLADSERDFGQNHPGSARLAEDVAETFLDEHLHAESENWFLMSLARYKEAHLPIGKILTNIGEMYKRKGDHDPHNCLSCYDESYRFTRLGLMWKRRELEKDHSSIMLTIRNLADLFMTIGMPGIALAWYKEARKAGERKMKEGDQLHFKHWHLIAKVLGALGRYHEALETCQRAVNGRKALREDNEAAYQESLKLLDDLRVQQKELLKKWDAEEGWQHLESL